MPSAIEWDPTVHPVGGTVNFTSPSTPSDTWAAPEAGLDSNTVTIAANTAAITAETARAEAAEALAAPLAGATFTGLIFPQQHATSGAPAYVKGGLYFDTTLNKLMVGGATAWETVTSS